MTDILPATPPVLRVLTLNLHRTGRDWTDRRRVIDAGLRELAPDLVAFQEAILTSDYDQAADLLGDEFQVFHQQARRSDGTGVSLGSRWPLKRSEEVDLHVTPRTGETECGALLAEVSAPAPFGPVTFVNYFPSWEPGFERERELQAVATERAIGVFRGNAEHVIVAGDFDADPDAASVRFWTGRQSLDGHSVAYRDAWASAHSGPNPPDGTTFSPQHPDVAGLDWPSGRIDYIMVRCGEQAGPTLVIRSCERVFDRPVDGVWPSDHFGLLAELAPRT